MWSPLATVFTSERRSQTMCLCFGSFGDLFLWALTGSIITSFKAMLLSGVGITSQFILYQQRENKRYGERERVTSFV